MPSKRILIAVTALIACMALGFGAVAVAKTKKITTTITLAVTKTPASQYAPYSPGSGTLSGQVSAKGPSGCREGRTVTISRGGPIVGSVDTDSNGSYSLTVAAAPPAGTYTASVPKVVINKKKKHKKFVCKGATSAPVAVP